ncbi:MAG: 4-hydroxy-tetrahydrodipicolinate reductase [bacterium]
MVRVAVAGAAGRMGSRIATQAVENPAIELVGAFERSGHEKIGEDIGTVIGIGKTGVKLSGTVDESMKDADVVIDFTAVEATLDNLKKCSAAGKAMVIGTTGFSADKKKEIESLTRNIPCVMAPNMSVGVNLLFKVLKDVARVLGDDYDIEIIEAHHRLKKDAPSGTALKLAQVVAEAMGRNLDEVAVYERKGLIGERKKKEIGIQTIRAGDIVGEHTVLFGTVGERVEITHKASSRDTFAKGAMRAALWVHGKKPGLYDMMDVLGLK